MLSKIQATVMKNASGLYDALSRFIGQCPWADQRHAYVLVWMVIGVIQEGSVNLTRWIGHVETSARSAQSTQRRFARWLHNSRIHPTHLYGSLIQAALSSWQDEVLYLSFDTTMLWDRFCVIRLAVVDRGRAIPVIWRVLEHGSSSVKFLVYQDLLNKADRLLPSDTKVVFLAERGFVDHQLLRHVRQILGWHYRVRLKSNSWVRRTGKSWQQLNQFHLGQGQASNAPQRQPPQAPLYPWRASGIGTGESLRNPVVDCEFGTHHVADPTRIWIEI